MLGLFVVGWLMLSAPLVLLWDVPVFVFGLPLMTLGLFGAWALLICVAAWIAETPGGS